MGIHSLCQSFFLLSLLFAVSFCSADNTFQVVGTTLCADCTQKTSQPFSGLHVTIDCKLETGETKRIGSGDLDNHGKFKILIEDGQNLNQECYAQLHSAAAVPCAAHDGLENTKILFKSQTNGVVTFSPSKTLRFSSALCSSKTFLPYFNHPPLPPHPWFHHPPIPLPPFTHPWHKSPPSPVYTPAPPVPVYKPKPKPPVPVYKPKPKPPVVVEPLPPPVYKPKPKPKPPVVKPLPPPVYKPKPKPPPVYKPPVPVYTPPIVKKPCPPLPKLPPIPPKYFQHPKFGHFPPLPPHHP